MSERTSLVGPLGLLTVAWLAVSCSDVVGPAHHARRATPLAAAMSPTASGISLDQLNGTFGESGRMLIKGFNPTNPHNGDAIVATFVWTGSAKIDSVTDVLTTTPYTPVGNNYTQVEYVTANGVSMATYVATNVQHFPDAYSDPSGTYILAVRANLSDSVPDGGVLISAWTGVAGLSTQALGAHRSAAGSGTTTTVADPGAIPVGGGTLAYAVSLSNALASHSTPAGFTTLASQSDLQLVDDAEYAVQASVGSVDPQWTWYFNSPLAPSTWLASVLALNPLTAPVANFTASCSGLMCSFDANSSTAQPTATYGWTWGDGASGTGKTATHSYAAPGTYSVTLTVTDGGGSSSKTQTVTVAPPPVARFTASCSGLTCSFDASSSTAQPMATYSWTWGDNSTGTGKTATHTYGSWGTYTATLTVTDAGGSSSTRQTVTANQPPIVSAGPNETVLLGVLYTLHASFSDPDNDGPWSYTIDWGDGSSSSGSTPSQGGITAGHNYLLAGAYTITVTVTDSRGASGSATKVLTVTL